MTNYSDNQRTMFILWRWKALHQNLDFDEVPISKSPNDKIIRINKDNIEVGISLICELAKKEKGTLFIFLHRNHGLNEKHVEIILSRLEKQGLKGQIIKCFLFSDGRDYIYYKTQREGLLDGIGGFFEGFYRLDQDGKRKKEFISVLEDDKKHVKYAHFNRTWKYYSNEFFEKINTLFIDLMAEFTFFQNGMDNDKTISSQSWKEELEQLDKVENKFLLYRLKSFLGLYDLNDDGKKDLEAELNALSTFEKKEEVSYVFDDVGSNLGKHHNDDVGTDYKSLQSLLLPIFTEVETNFSLKTIRDHFETLLQTLNNK